MYYVIKDNSMYEFADRLDAILDYPELVQEFEGITMYEYQMNIDKYSVENGKLVDISQTKEYLAKTAEMDKLARKQEIQSELDSLDLKCIRAIREGGVDEDGVDFLDKYQSQIIELRNEYNSL